MTVTYTTPNGRITVTANVASAQDRHRMFAAVDELCSETECGMCKSKDIRFVVRRNKSGDWFEMRCNACPAQLDFGARKDGGLWVKNQDESTYKPLPNRGWHVYDRNAPRSNGVPTEESGSEKPAANGERQTGDEPAENIPW